MTTPFSGVRPAAPAGTAAHQALPSSATAVVAETAARAAGIFLFALGLSLVLAVGTFQNAAVFLRAVFFRD